MNKIVEKEVLSENVVKLVVEAPLVSRKQRPGQFVIVRTDEKGERIPLTIADADPEKGTITLIIQKVGTSSHKITGLNPGESLSDVVRSPGPGHPYRNARDGPGLRRRGRHRPALIRSPGR